MTAIVALDDRARERQRARQWVRAAQEGCDRSFASLVRLYADRLLWYIERMGIAHADAEDLVQETFIRAHAALGRYDERYAVATWLYTIGRRLALNHLRDRRALQSLERIPDPDAGASSDDPDRTALWDRARELLPERQFEALWLRYAADHAVADIAAIMGVSSSNAKVLVHRARGRLAEALDPADWLEGGG